MSLHHDCLNGNLLVILDKSCLSFINTTPCISIITKNKRVSKSSFVNTIMNIHKKLSLYNKRK